MWLMNGLININNVKENVTSEKKYYRNVTSERKLHKNVTLLRKTAQKCKQLKKMSQICSLKKISQKYHTIKENIIKNNTKLEKMSQKLLGFDGNFGNSVLVILSISWINAQQ